MEPVLMVAIGVGGTLVGILAGRVTIRQGQKEQLADDVKASDPIRAHIKGIANDCADERIEVAAEKKKWLDERDGKSMNDRFDRLERRVDDFQSHVTEQFERVNYKLENGLAARIANEVSSILGDRGVFAPGEEGPTLPVRKTRKTPAKP